MFKHVYKDCAWSANPDSLTYGFLCLTFGYYYLLFWNNFCDSLKAVNTFFTMYTCRF